MSIEREKAIKEAFRLVREYIDNDGAYDQDKLYREYLDKKKKIDDEYLNAKEAGDGSKKDEGKLRYELLPADVLEELVKTYMVGATKYPKGDYSTWTDGMKWSRVFGALMRHAWRWWRGERYDPVDGQSHLTAIIWNAMTLCAYELRNIGEDNRPHKDLEVKND